PTPQEGLARSRTPLRHLVPPLAHAQRAAPLAQHVPEPRRAEPRILLQHLAGKAHVRVESARPGSRLGSRLLRERSFYRLVVSAEIRWNRAHRPRLGEV